MVLTLFLTTQVLLPAHKHPFYEAPYSYLISMYCLTSSVLLLETVTYSCSPHSPCPVLTTVPKQPCTIVPLWQSTWGQQWPCFSNPMSISTHNIWPQLCYTSPSSRSFLLSWLFCLSDHSFLCKLPFLPGNELLVFVKAQSKALFSSYSKPGVSGLF